MSVQLAYTVHRVVKCMCVCACCIPICVCVCVCVCVCMCVNVVIGLSKSIRSPSTSPPTPKMSPPRHIGRSDCVRVNECVGIWTLPTFIFTKKLSSSQDSSSFILNIAFILSVQTAMCNDSLLSNFCWQIFPSQVWAKLWHYMHLAFRYMHLAFRLAKLRVGESQAWPT